VPPPQAVPPPAAGSALSAKSQARLASAGGSGGPRFEAGGLDGDQLQAMVFRYWKVLRPKD
jgi:hypothetical protein